MSAKKMLVVAGIVVCGLVGPALPALACNAWCEFGVGCHYESFTTNMYCVGGTFCWEEQAWGCFAGPEAPSLFATPESAGASTPAGVDEVLVAATPVPAPEAVTAAKTDSF